MPTLLNVLIVEDSPNDAELTLAELRRAGFDPKWKRVETEPDFLAELKHLPDIILSDYSMPQFTGLRAAELLGKSGLHIPFILISGTVGEDVAVEAMQHGATDYLLKDRIARLGAAVKQALEKKLLEDESKRIEASLKLFRTLIDQSHDGIEVIDPETGRFLDINTTTCRRLGYTREELLSMTVPEIDFTAVTFDTWWKNVAEVRRAGFKIFEGRHRRKDGSTFPVEINVRYVKLERDYLIAAVRDITEREQTDEKLRQSEADLAEGQRVAKLGSWRLDIANNKLRWSDELYLIFEVEPAVFHDTYENFLNCVLPEDRLLVLQTNADAKAKGSSFEMEYRIQTRVGNLKTIHEIGYAMKDAGGKVVSLFGTAQDITERKQLEEQFRQAQKMEAVGQLAGGVAHDFNNILSVIQMQADLLKSEGPLSPVQLEFANDITAAAQRAAALTRQLLMFSRKQILKPCDLDLNESINEMTRLLRRTLGEHIQLKFKFAMQPLFVRADAGMMDQALMNLAVNARDAMPEGGQLVIETSAVEFDEAAVSHSGQIRPGKFICLSVSDTGCGIPVENLSRIFEPFFTTKETGKGTGLGLATVFGIVQQHQGWINVYSEVGRGTTFRIYLPRLAGISEQKPEKPKLTTMRGGNETILLVEDDTFLRASICKALTQLGYRVLEAVNGVEALDVWNQHRAGIHLLLTDLVMPGGISGMELAGQLLEMKPELKVIYASGYSAEVASKDFPLEEGINFLTKPFAVQKLAQTIRSSLDKTA